VTRRLATRRPATRRPPRPAGGLAWRRLSPLAAIASAAAIAAAGCATVPTSGQARQISEPRNGLAQGADFPQLIPFSPGSGWSPQQIVSGFLVASASFAGDHSVARQYLSPRQAQIWRPGSAVTVVSEPRVTHVVAPRRVTGQSTTARVVVSGQELATLNATGQYQIPPVSSRQFLFKLMRIRNQWRILNPPRGLLLSKADFDRVYQPRDLYYFASSGTVLVPDPVFVPLEATTTSLATGLVTALLGRPVGWLQGATSTDFPRGTRLLGQVRIEGTSATVNLGGSAARAGPATLASIAAQLVWTLTSPSYGRSAISSVRLEIDGHQVDPAGSAGGVELLGSYLSKVPTPAAKNGLYFIGVNGAVHVLSATSAAPADQVPGQAGTGLVPMTGIAVSPSERFLAGISPDRRVIYVTALAKGAALRSWQPGGVCTALSWDARGDLWVATKAGVWLRPPGGKAPIAVDVTPRAGRIIALRVAPDGVRIAMIVRSATGSQVLVGAVVRGANRASIGQLVPIGAGISDPAALGWYDADDLIVLARAGTRGAQFERVPVNGSQPTLIAAEPDASALATTESQIVAGLPGGRMVAFASATGSWAPLGPGEDPVFPG
jgi:hypothetical protein